MLSDYESYIFSLRDNLIQCGVDLSVDIKENTSYKDLFFLSLKISDILYFYRVMAVSPDYALRDFMLPLNKNYKDVIRGISYGEFVETILPDYRVLTGDNGDYDLDEDFDDDEDFDESDSESESEGESVYTEPSTNTSDSTDNSDFSEFGDDLYASMFGSEDDDISDTPSDTEETVEIASRLDTPVENDIYSTDIGGSYVEDIPLPDIEDIDEIVDWLDDDYDYVDHGSYIEDIKPVDTSDSETDNVSDGGSEGSKDAVVGNDSEDSNVNEDIDYVPNGIYLEEYNPSSNGYNNEETVWDEDVEGSEGYSEEEEVTWDEPEESEEEEVTWDDSEEEEVTWDGPEESEEEEVTWDESEEETWDEPDEEDGEVTWDDSDEEEVWDEPDEEDVVESSQEEVVSTEAQETQVSGDKETEKSLKDRLFGTDDLGEAVQGVTNSVLTKLKRSTISFLNGRNGKV